MATIEERVSYLEGQLSEQSHAWQTLRDDIHRVEERMEARFVGFDQRFVSIDQRFATIDQRLVAIDERFADINRRFEGLDNKISTQFLWLVGIQVTTLVAIVGALLARA